jgi:superfamily II DNA helicase RecQ
LVVIANSKSILNIKYAPKEIKNKIIKSDNLVKLLKSDVEKTEKECLWNQKDMKECAFSVMDRYNNTIERNYEQELIDWIEESKKNQDKNDCKKEKQQLQRGSNIDIDSVHEIRKRLVEFRKEKSKAMNVPAYYIFTNDELDKILKLMPTSLDELKKTKILSPIKTKTHGEEILKIIMNGY